VPDDGIAVCAEDRQAGLICVDMQERLAAESTDGVTKTAMCLAGLTDSAVPVRVGDKVLGYLQTGQIALTKLIRHRRSRPARWPVRRRMRGYFGSSRD